MTGGSRRGRSITRRGRGRGGAAGNVVKRANAKVVRNSDVVIAAVAPNRPPIAVATKTNSSSPLGRNAVIRSEPAAQQIGYNSQSAPTTMSTTPTSSSVQQTSHNNYEIQTEHFLQNRSRPRMAEKDRFSARMLVLSLSGEARLITFKLPLISCTVQHILEKIGEQFDSTTIIKCVEHRGLFFDFVVTIGFPVDEYVIDKISRCEQILRMRLQQEESTT